MIQIPAGRFVMGSPEDEPHRYSDEGPQHEVSIQGFFMAQTPITQGQWRVVAGWEERDGERWNRDLKVDPARFINAPDSDQRPVESVSWHDAMEFCNRLSQRSGRVYTLPSEAQWEYSCRAGSTSPFHVGETLTPKLANYDGSSAFANGPDGVNRKQTTPVDLFAANAWGLCDMHGNVLEWCLDEWHDSYLGAPAGGMAWIDAEGESARAGSKWEKTRERVVRGGSWDFYPGRCRSAYRYRLGPGLAGTYIGFRVVCLTRSSFWR